VEECKELLIVAYYVMYDRSITLQRLTAQHSSSKCRSRGREEKKEKREEKERKQKVGYITRERNMK